MKWIYSIHKDNEEPVARMTYDWNSDKWHISVFPGVEVESLPVILMISMQQGNSELDDSVCRLFIRDRVIPANRQNIGDILRKMNVPCYNEAYIFKYIPRSCMDDYLVDFQEEV